MLNADGLGLTSHVTYAIKLTLYSRVFSALCFCLKIKVSQSLNALCMCLFSDKMNHFPKFIKIFWYILNQPSSHTQPNNCLTCILRLLLTIRFKNLTVLFILICHMLGYFVLNLELMSDII